MGILDDGSWSDIGTTSQTKSADLFDKAVQKQANIHRKAAGLKSQREVQGVQPILDEGVNSFTYDNVNSARNDGDSHGATTDEGYDHGQRFKYNDTPETKNLTASQRATQYPWAASYYGIPLERVTDELIYASGRMSTDRKNALISEGQGTLTEEGFVERSPADMQPVYDKDGELISGMEPQWYRIEGESTYDPASTRYKGDKRIKFDSVTNPYTGVDVIEAMNTPEHNVRWFNDNPRQNAIREAYDAEHGTAKGAGTLPSLVQVKANRKYGFDVFRPKDASNPTHTGFRKNNLNEVDAKRLADLANKHPEATLDELMGSTVSNSLAKFGQSTLNITGDLAQGASRPVRAALEFDTDLKELTKKRFQHGTAFMPKTDTDHKIKDYYFDENAQISGINLDRAHDRFLDLSERSRSQFSAEDTEFYDSFLGKSFQDANETVVAAKWRAAASKETAEQIDAYSKLLDDVVIRTMRAQREDARFTKTYQSIAHNEDGSAKDLSYKALGAITAFSEMYANDPTQAPIDFFTNLPYMVGLVYTGVPGAAALISAKDEDLVAEWQEMNPGKTQTSEERFITAGSSALAVGAEYFGDRFILKGKLEVLQKAMDRVAVKSNILTKAVVKTGEYATKGAVSTVVEGASGGTTEFAEQYAVEQDLTKIDDTKVSLSAAHEARAGSAGGVIMDAGRDVLPSDVNTNKVKLDKRNDILKNDKLTDQQRARVVKSRDKTIQNLIGQRHKIKLKDIDTVVGLTNIPEKIKKSLKQLISKNELEDTDLDAYLDELNTIAQFSNAITGESGTTIEDSQTLLDILKNKPEEEIVDPTNPKDAKEALAGHYRLITALEKGIAEHNRRAQIDVILAQVTDVDSSDALTITVLNNARKNAIAYTKANAADNIQYIKDDYKELTGKYPENTATYIKREAEQIANEEQILADELIRLNTPIAKTLDKAKVTAVNSESANTSFKPVGGIDVTHPTYNAQSEVDQILDKGIKTIIKDPELSKNLLIHNSNLDIQIKNLIKAGNTEDAAILQGQRKSYDEIVAAIRKKVTDEKTRTEVVPTETEEVLFSIDPSTLDSNELNNLDDSKLTEEQLELKRLQLERSALNSERADKNVADVHEEIMFGDNDTKRSFTYYEGQANDAMTGTERNQLGKFVQHMNKKSEVLSGAYNQVISGTPNMEIEVDAAPAIDYVKESANELNKISNYLHGAIDREMSGMFASMMKGTAHQMLNKELSQFSNLDNITENSLKGMRSMMLDKMQGQVSNKNIAEYVKAFDAYAQGVLNMQKAKALGTNTASKTTKKVAAQVIWIKKDDLDAAPILQAVEYVDNPAGLEYENLENPEQVTSHYKIHRNSGNLIEAIKKEAEYGVVTEQVINKILDGKQAITDQNADRFSADEITAIENALPTEMSDLDVQTLNTGEILDDTTETAEPVEVVQTESVETETVETTPVPEVKVETKVEVKPTTKTEEVKPAEFPVTIGKQELVIKGAKVYSAKSGKEVTVQRTVNRAFGVKAHNEGRAVNVTYKDKSYLVNDKGVILTKAKTNSGNIVHTKEDSVRAGILEAANQVFIQKGSPIRLVEQVDIAEVIVEDAQQTKANAVELNKVPVVKAKAKPTESKKVVVETEVIAEITKVNTDGTVGIPGNSIIKQYDGKFPNISSQSGEGNITNHFGTKNKKRESVFTLSKSGGVSIDTIKSSSEVLVAKVNQKLQEKGQDPIDANPMYLEILGNTVTNFKKDYAAKGPKIATTAGVSVTKSLKAFHVKDSQGKYTLPDEVFLAAAITGLQWLSENSGRLNSKDDTQVKGFLGLDSKEKLSNTERATVEDMGYIFPDASGRLGKQILEALNIKALRDTEYVLKRGEATVSPEHTQESVEMALGMLALTMLSSIDASTIETRFNPGSGPLINMQNVKLTDLPIRSNIDSETLIKDAEGNTIDPAEGNFLMDETGNFINTFVDKYGNVKEVSHPMSKKSFTTLRLNDSITSASNKKEENNALKQFIQFIRSQSSHAEALLGHNISKNGVFSKPVLEVQTNMRGSLSKVSTRRQALMKRLQSIPQQGKVGELALWNSLSLEAQQHISGVTDVDTKHITRRDSFTASNKALLQEIDIINMYDNAVFYYQYGVQKQGRMMIKSSGINPMNSKIHRHLVAAKSNPTTVTAKDTAMRNIFKIAVAAAFGAPIDKQGAQKSIDDFADIMGNPVVATALDILRDPEQAALHEEAILSVHEFIQVDPAGNETKPYANKVHLLEGLAALLAYSEGNFKTDITVEIDGITNGYAISLLQFGGKNLKQALAQVGVSLGNAEDYGTWLADPSNIDVYLSLAKEMNAQRNSASIVEYYEKAYTDPSTGELKYPKGLLAVMERLTKSVNGKPVVNTNAFISLDRIDGEIKNKEGDLTKFARDLAKDPLMTTNYSAQLNTVLGKMTKSAIESMYDKMAKIQLEYDTGDKGKAEKSAKDLGNAIGLFLGFEVGTVNLVAELAQGNLKNYKLHPTDINKLMSAIRYIYKPSLDAGLTKILGKEGDVSTLRGRKTLVTRGYEWIYTGYVEAYEDGVTGLGVKHPTREQKREVARSLQGTYYPKYQSAWDDTGENETFIDILTSKQVDSTETIQYEYAMPGYTTYYKGAKPLSESARKSKDAKTRNTTLSTTEPDSPGAKAIVNATQSVDADSMGTVSEVLEFLTLYDAGIFSIKDLQQGKELYNDVFINMNLAHNFMEVTIENMKKLQKLLAKDPDRAKAVAERYFKESHETKHLPFDSPIREEVTLSAAITSLEDALRNVKRELLLLEGLNKVTEEVVKKDGTTETLTHYPNVYQLNWPDVSKVTDNADTHYSLKANIGAQVHRMFYTEGSAKNVSDLFDFFGNRAKKFYHSPEAYAKETRQLGEVIDKLILPAVGILDNLSIEGLSAKTFAHGKYEPGKTKVTVTANKSKPETYSESTGQEVYVHELVHAITQVGIEHDSAIRPELQRIYNYLRKEVTVNDFLDPHTLKSEQAEKEAAQRIYDRVFPKTGGVKSELHELMAHGLTNPALIRKLETLKPVTANMDLKGRSVLEAFHNIIERIVNVFRRVFNGEKVPKNIHDQLFSLAQRINTINMDQRGAVAKYLYNKNIVLRHKQANTLFAKGVNYVLNGGAKKVGDHLSKRREKRKENPSKSIVVRTLKNIENIPLIGAKLISSKQARKAMEKSISRANGAVGNFVRSTINELGSLTPMEFVNMMFLSNKNVDAERRKAKELLASVLKSSFVGKKEPTHHQLVALTRFVLKTDASALLHNDTYTMDEVLNMFKDPKYLAQQLQKYHAKLDTANNSYYRNNVNGLADLMVFGETTQNNSMMNAYFISTLGSKSNIKDWEDLDMLISLVAIHKTVNAFEGAQEDLVKLINSEMSVNRDVNGVTEMLLEHQAFKTRARDKNFTDKNGNVQYGLMAKGYIAKLYDSTHDMVTEPLRVPKKSLTGKVVKGSDGKPVMIDNIEVMRKLGYEYQGKVPDVNGLNIGPVGLFVNKLTVETGRTKGIASATALKAFGTSIMGILAKNVLLKGQLRSTIGLMVRSEGAKATDKNTNGVHAKAPRAMIPRRNSTGKIVDYRISIKHDKVEALLNQNLDAIEVLATMESHMIDKEASEEVNDSIIKLLTKDRKSMSAKDAHNWVDILSLDYHEEYVSNFPKKMRQAIVRNSTIDDKGKAQFFVQKRVLDVAFGFKQVSVGDALPDGRFKRVATLVEGLWQWATHRAIVNVVVKIPAVGTANVTSNFAITLLHGMWPHKTIAALYKAWKALDQYQADVDTLTKMIYKAQARPELLNNPKTKRKMELLGNNISKNRLHKFMSKGLFTSITEDIHVSEHASKRSIDAFVKDRFGITIPKPMIKAAQHLYLGSTTPTGNALVKFLQMSDFLFRVVLFEHRVNKSGWSEQRAWNLIVKTFISYDVPLNKHAQYANDMSVIWFYKYWVRIQYVAFNEIKKRPANALLYFFGQELIDTDSPDIFDSSFIDGNFMPTDAGILKTLEELLVPPAFEIATGESL